MITDCYDIQSEPLLSLRDFYGEPGHKVEKCLILFSKHIHQHLLVNFDCEPIGTLNSCNGSKTIYQFCHEGENIGFYLTDLGSALAGSLSMVFGCALRAPHGGIFVFPVVDHVLLYVVALAAGSAVGAVILSLLKKDYTAE